MTSWKRFFIVPSLAGAALALLCVFIARQEAAHLIWPAWVVPFQGSALLSTSGQEPPAWLFHAVLFLQFYVLALVLVCLAGRFRSGPAKV